MTPRSELPEPSLRDYLRVVRRRKGVVVVAVAVALGIALGISFTQDRLYRATARVLLQPAGGERIFDSSVAGRPGDPARALETELDLIKNLAAPASLPQASDGTARISAEAAENADIIKVHATAEDPRIAARAANAYARSYIELRRRQAAESLQAAARQLEAKIAELDRQIAALPAPAPAAPGQPTIDDQGRALLVGRQSAMRQKLDEIQVEAALTTAGVQLAAPASVPTEPSQPRPVRNGVLAASLGLMVGLGMAFLLEQFDDRIRTRGQLLEAVRDLSVVGTVPVARSLRRRSPEVVMLGEHDQKSAEAYRSLRTSLQYLGVGKKIGMLQVTSPTVGEGKSTVVANLAVALAQAGMEVIVVSCDLRRPFVHRLFGLDNEPGFSSVVKHGASLSDSLQRVGGNLPISFLASGPAPTNPSELLSSRAAERVFAELREMAEIVLVDSPPLLPVADASVLVQHVDATLLVASADTTRRRHLTRGLEILRQIDASVIGVVLNRAGDDDGYGEYRYEPAPPKVSQRK